ncbi:L-histidine N(alpha)-methyltransferase [Parvularcula lutaonensis]|uniref:L-histidine N(Alpha)-methyltransferase n=1 Tax=Parvularcula lutaonensis TaxID=491923 RepID=A0ABV7MFD6_9PROT|nr:L-histidine N(alpha)-methyltransferase [Parvularcula lutaonensis]GGY55545.1 dimethylhistidine N-methyltransferase [Parvularcula lutaonensis]
MNDEFLRDLREGLSKPQKSIPPKYLYDAVGSELFEAITRTEDYYVTRTEAGIMETVYGELPEFCPPGAAIAEFGSGAGVKSQRLVDALKPSVYVMIDVAEEFLKASAEKMRSLFPDTEVHGVVGDFSGTVALPSSFLENECRMGFFPGSTIGNFEAGGAQDFLARSRESLGKGALFLIGADLVKDEDILLAAYDDSEGITRQFTLNVLERMNRELDAGVDLSKFEAVALWNPTEARMELGVVALAPQAINLGGERISIEKGEMIHTENSHKYTRESMDRIARAAGWEVERVWTDPREWFGVFLLKAA